MSKLLPTPREQRVIDAFAAQYEADGHSNMARMFREHGMAYSGVLAAISFANDELKRAVLKLEAADGGIGQCTPDKDIAMSAACQAGAASIRKMMEE